MSAKQWGLIVFEWTDESEHMDRVVSAIHGIEEDTKLGKEEQLALLEHAKADIEARIARKTGLSTFLVPLRRKRED